MNNKPRISVITVVYNDESHILSTLESVRAQTCGGEVLEHLVIDGQSTDKTAEICREFCRTAAHVQFVSEPDKGIYDAMNKGLQKAAGDWLLFLNSGDVFFDARTAEKVLEFADAHADCDLIICDFIRDGKESTRCTPWILEVPYTEHIPCSHQACLIKRETHLRHPYNLYYRLAADYDMLYSVLQEGGTWAYCPQILSSFLSGGLSDTRRFEIRKEWILVKCRQKWWRVPFYLMGRVFCRMGKMLGKK